MDGLYKEIILDYFRHPRNKGSVKNPDIKARDTNTLCGDVVEITCRVENNIIREVRFDGRGCAISQAAASMLTELLEGKSVKKIAAMEKHEILEILGIDLSHSPSRIKCALLGFKVMKIGVYSYIGKKMSLDEKDELDE